MRDDSLKPPQISHSLPLDEDPSNPKQFILQEAEEKANEISISAEEEFNIEKLQLVEAEKKKIKQEYGLKEKQVEVRKKM